MKKTTLRIAACAVAFCGSEMGRRSRQRLKTKVAVPPTRRDRMARVNVADDVWADFRSLAGDRPIAAILGELVTREVTRDRSRRVREGQLDDRELVDALERARATQAELETLVDRVERRLDQR
jgi:hypothetical protein